MAESPKVTWSDFYRATAGRDPRDLFVTMSALSHAAEGRERQAVDLGCGDGTEALRLLEWGWQVLAVDREPEALDVLRAKVPEGDRGRLSAQIASFESLEFPMSDLIYCGFSLFFCPPGQFPDLWSRMSAAVQPGGWLAAHFLGKRDSWATNADMTSHEPDSLRELFGGFAIEHFVEVEHDRPAVSGPKHWHLFEVIARKVPS